MSATQTIPTGPMEHPSMDYAALRAEGIRLLERLSDPGWSDFNAHDPGITILEQLCYAITELGYRAGHAMPDLLAGGGGDPYRSLHGARAILTTEPVTLIDLRKIVLDVAGVQNAWVEPVDAPSPALSHHGGEREIRLRDPGAPADRYSAPVALRGLLRVLVATSDLADIDGAAVRREVLRTLHAHRPLCVDFTEVRVLDPEEIEVGARAEIAPGHDPAALLLDIYDALSARLAPSVRFRTLGEMIAAGKPIDEIFAGPRLARGFLDDAALAALARRTELHTSDVLRDLMDVPGVRAVHDLTLKSAVGGGPERSRLALDAGRTPRFDLRRSRVVLTRGGIEISLDPAATAEAYLQRRRGAGAARALADEDLDRLPPAGRDRGVGRSASILHQMPACYGVGELGLPASAPPSRRARQKQLRAYLLFFDQLLSNAFAQLAHAGRLLSFHGEGAGTYASQPVLGDSLDLGAIRRRDDAAHAAWLTAVTEETAAARSSVDRPNRFLDHLLARFAESHPAYAPIRAPGEAQAAALARDKRAFLQAYPRIGGARGTGADITQPAGAGRRSGLEERIQRSLGLSADHEETFLLIEHILLRPIDDDRNQLGEDEVRPVPLVSAARSRDPFSLQLTFVFPSWPLRFNDTTFRDLVEQTVRAETPAHLAPYVRWLPRDPWIALKAAHDEWIERHRGYWTEKLGM